MHYALFSYNITCAFIPRSKTFRNYWNAKLFSFLHEQEGAYNNSSRCILSSRWEVGLWRWRRPMFMPLKIGGNRDIGFILELLRSIPTSTSGDTRWMGSHIGRARNTIPAGNRYSLCALVCGLDISPARSMLAKRNPTVLWGVGCLLGIMEPSGENVVLLRLHFLLFFRKLNPLIDWFIH